MQTASPAPSRRRRIALAAILAIAAPLALAVTGTPWAVRHYGERALADAGFPEARIGDVGFLRNGLRIGHVTLDGESRLKLSGIEIRLGWASVQDGRAKRVAVRKATFAAAIADDGTIRIPGYHPVPETAPDVAAPPAIPAEHLYLRSARIVLATPAGEAAIDLADAGAEITDGQIVLSAMLQAAHRQAQLAGSLTATAVPSAGVLQARLGITGGSAEMNGLSVMELSGTASIGVSPDAPLSAAFELAAEQSRLRDIPLGAMRLAGELSGETLSYALSSPSGGVAAFDLAGEADLAGGTAHLAGELRIPDLSRLPELGAAGRVELRPDVGIDWRESPLRLAGDVALAAENLMFDGLLHTGGLRLAARLGGTPERLAIRASAPWTAEAVPAPDLLPDAMAAYRGRPIRLALAPRAGAEAMMLRLDLPAGIAELDARAELTAGETRITAGAAFALRQAEAGPSAEAQALTLSANGLQLAEMTLDLDDFTGAAALSPARDWHLAGTGGLRARGTAGRLRAAEALLAWAGRIDGDATSVRLLPDRCLAMQARGLEIDDLAIASLDPPCLSAREGAPLLRAGPADDAVAIAATTAAAPLDLRLRQADAEYHLVGSWPALDLTARLGAAGGADAQVAISGGRLQSADAGIEIDSIGGALRLGGGEIEKADLTASAIESLAVPALWVPLSLEATAERADGALGFEAFLSDAQGILVLELAGRHSGASGNADITLYPIRFIPEATEAASLSPALAALLTGVSGPLGFDGRLAWGSGDLESAGTLALGPLSAGVAGVPVSGFEGRIAFDSLLPPVTAGTQELRLAAANIGLLLAEGRMRFALRPGGEVAVDALGFDLAGGRLTADPFMLDLSRIEDTRVVLRAEGVDLAQMVRLSGIDGLDGTGTLTGRLPLALTAEGLRIADGVLAAAGTGVLRYIPDELPDFLRGDDLRTRMLRQALENFQYESLSLTLSGDVGAEQRIALSARGANPDFLEGHPVELDLAVQGPLVSVVQSAVGGSGARALERMFRESETGAGRPDGREDEENQP